MQTLDKFITFVTFYLRSKLLMIKNLTDSLKYTNLKKF